MILQRRHLITGAAAVLTYNALAAPSIVGRAKAAGPSGGGSSGGVSALKAKAQRLLAGAMLGALPVVMASPPTVAQNTASAITGTTYAYNDPAIRYLGTVTNDTTLGGQSIAGHVDYGTFRNGPIQQVEFMANSAVVEISAFSNPVETWRLFVDDQAVSLTPAAYGTGNYSITYISLTFATAATRRFRFETSNQGCFGGVKVPTNYNVWQSPPPGLRAMIVGDSYPNGNQGDGTYSPHTSLGRQAGFRLGVRDWWISTMAGEGYTANGNQSGKTLRARAITDIIAYAPDWVILPEGINTGGAAAAAVTTEVSTLYALLLAGLPNTIFTVIGPWRAPSLNPSQAYADAIKAGVAAQPEYAANGTGRIAYIDTFAEGWQQIAGKVGSVSGAGNSNIYVGPDGIHFIQAGHDYGGGRVAAAGVRHLTAFAA